MEREQKSRWDGGKWLLYKFNSIVRIVIMAIITASVLEACGVPPEEKEARAKAALEEKYNKTFEIIQVYPQKFGDLYYEVQAYAVDEPELRFTATIDTEDNGVSDSYVERRVCAAISSQAAENLDSLPGYYYLVTRALGPQPSTADAQISIQDYVALHPNGRFQIYLFVTPDQEGDKTSIYQSLEKLLGGLEYLRVNVGMYVVDEAQIEAVQEYWELNDTPDLDYKEMTAGFFFLELPFEQGTLGMSQEQFFAKVRDGL